MHAQLHILPSSEFSNFPRKFSSFPYLIVVLEGRQEVMEVVIVALLQVLSHGSDDTSHPVLPTEILARNAAMEQVSCPVGVRLDEDSKGVVGRHSQGVLDPVVKS